MHLFVVVNVFTGLLLKVKGRFEAAYRKGIYIARDNLAAEAETEVGVQNPKTNMP